MVAILIAISVALAGFGAYEYSQYSYEAGIASSYSNQVSSIPTLQLQLSQAQANATALTTLRNSLQTELAQANSNAASLQGQIDELNGRISQLNGQINTYESLLNLSVTRTLVSSQAFNLPPAGSADYTSTATISVPITTTTNFGTTSTTGEHRFGDNPDSSGERNSAIGKLRDDDANRDSDDQGSHLISPV